MSATLTAPAPAGIDPKDHLLLVFKVAKHFARRDHRLDADELANVGFIGLTKAVQKHDPEHGNFAAYAWHYVAGEIRGHLKRERRRFMQQLPEVEDGHTLDPEAPPEIEPCVSQDAAELLRRLTTVERRVVELRFGLLDGQERTCEEIAALIGFSRVRAGFVLRRALAGLREREGLGEADATLLN